MFVTRMRVLAARQISVREMSVASRARKGTGKNRRGDHHCCCRLRRRTGLQEIQVLLARQRSTQTTAKENGIQGRRTTICVSVEKTDCCEVAREATRTEENRNEEGEADQAGNGLTIQARSKKEEAGNRVGASAAYQPKNPFLGLKLSLCPRSFAATPRSFSYYLENPFSRFLDFHHGSLQPGFQIRYFCLAKIISARRRTRSPWRIRPVADEARVLPSLHIRVRASAVFGNEAVDPRSDDRQRYRAEL